MAESMLPSAWQQWAAPSALPLSTKLGTAVAGVVKDCVDPVARPFRCHASAESQKTEHLDRPSCQDPHAEPTNRSTGPCRAVTRWGEASYRFVCRTAGNPNTRFTRLPNVQSEGGARRAGGALGGRGIVIPPRDRSTGSTSHAIQQRHQGSRSSAGKWAAAPNQPSHDPGLIPRSDSPGRPCLKPGFH